MVTRKQRRVKALQVMRGKTKKRPIDIIMLISRE
jgi:hypothetical protein